MTPEKLLTKEKSQELVPAFDIRSYWGLEEPEVQKRLVEDLPSYVIEQGELSDRDKTTTGIWLIKEGEVLHPVLGPVIDYISQETSRDKQEYEAFLTIRRHLVEKEQELIVCWFSPRTSEKEKKGYSESRIVVYAIGEEEGEKVARYYEFCGLHSFEQQRQIANQFRAYSQEEYYFPNLEKLRATPILLKDIKLKEVVEAVATYPGAWDDIRLGRVSERMKKVQEAAKKVTAQATAEIMKRQNPIYTGARIEQAMQEKIFWNISVLGGCGFSNNFLLSMVGTVSETSFRTRYSFALGLSEDKIAILGVQKEKKFSGECPVCHKVIPKDQAISPGERCPFCHTKWECY